MVASSVDTLKPENVTVVGADGRPLSQGGRGVSMEQAKLEALLASRLEATLAPVIGEGRMRATVNVEYDSSSTETQQETYDPQKAVVVASQQSEDRQGAGAASGGVPGTTSNVPQAAVNAPPAAALTRTTEDGQYQKTQSETYAVSKSIRHNVQPAGAIKRIATAVLIDDAVDYTQENGKNVEKRRKRTPEELAQLENLAKAAVDFDTTRGDTFVLQSLPFQIVPIEPPKPQNFKEKVNNVVTEWKNSLRYLGMFAALIAIYLLMIRPMQRSRALAASAAAETEATPARLAPAPTEIEEAAFLAAPPAATAQITQAMIKDDEAFLEGELHKELSSTSSDVKRAVILKRHLVEKVKSDPAVASRLLQNWLRAKGDRH